MSFLKTILNPADSDEALVSAYKQSGNLEILGKLYGRYMDLVYGVCLKYLRNTEAAQDAVMQIFEQLVEKLRKHPVDSFKSWLYTVSRNYCLMQLRSPKNLKTVELKDFSMQSQEDTHLNGIMQKEEDFKKLEKCMETLSPEQKECVELFYLKDKCYKEIADITGRDLNKVRSLIQNGRRNLKICAGDESGEL